MLRGIVALDFVLVFIASQTRAQQSNVNNCVPEYQWSINSRGQTPCLVGAYLETLCSGTSATVNAIPPGFHYLGPPVNEVDPCLCNSVTYSVISACGGCQNRTFISYPEWTGNCSSVVQIGQYPKTIPDTIELPSWARLNISLTNNTFSPPEAKRVASIAAPRTTTPINSTPSPFTSSSVPSQSFPPSSAISSTGSPLPTTTSQGSNGGNTGVIAGSVVGSVTGTAITIVLVVSLVVRARKRKNPKPTPLDDPLSPIDDKPPNSSSFPFGHVHSRSLSDPASAITPYMYSTSEGEHRPFSPGASSFYTTIYSPGSPDGITNPHIVTSPHTLNSHQSAGTPGGYTGAAEV